MKFFLVGGAVRDELLKRPVHERDWVVVGATPETMLRLNYKPVGKDFPVFLHPKTHEEYALARTERKIKKGYRGFEFYTDTSVTLEEDLQRRDLTINAIAKDSQGHFIDPYHGIEDIKHKRIRHVSEAFAEDPVRILRAARFYASLFHLGFHIAPQTIQLMRLMVANGEVDALVPERVWQEFYKALNSKHPEKFIEALRACGALKVIMPEIEALFGVPNKSQHHPEIDSGIHTLMVLKQAAELTSNPTVRFAALTHDFGKALTPMTEWPSHKGHGAYGIPTVKEFCKRLNVPKAFQSLALSVCRLHDIAHKAYELKPNTILKLFTALDAFRNPHKLDDFLLACKADSRGRTGFETIDYQQANYLKTAFESAKAVSIKPLLEKGLQNEALKNAIIQSRIKAIAAIKKD